MNFKHWSDHPVFKNNRFIAISITNHTDQKPRGGRERQALPLFAQSVVACFTAAAADPLKNFVSSSSALSHLGHTI